MLSENHCLLYPTISVNFGQYYILFITALSVLIAIPGNFLITYTIFKSTTLWNQPSFRCIASVSIADFFVALVGQPLFLTMMTTPYNPYLHCVTYAVVWTICSASGFGVIFITIERYLFIEHPLKYEVIFNEKRTLYLILCQWLLSIAFGTIPLIYRNDKIWSSFYLLTLVSANILMVVAYYKIRKSVIKHQKIIKQAVTSTPEETAKKAHNETSKEELLFICYRDGILRKFVSTFSNMSSSSNLPEQKLDPRYMLLLVINICIFEFIVQYFHIRSWE